MSRIEAVSFDLDDTLLRYERSPGEVLRIAFERAGVDPLFSVDDYYDRYDEFARQYDSMAELRSACFAELAAENGYERHLGRAVADAFRAERDQSNVELLPSVPDVLDELSRRYRLAVITNGAPDSQRRKIGAADLDRWIDAVVVAGHESPPKPSPEPFERALRSLDAAPETTVHVGDSLDTDVRGAAAAGLESVWVSSEADERGPGNPEPTYRVETIDTLSSPPWAD